MYHDPDGSMGDAEYATWHLYDAGGPRLRLKVRFIEGSEVPNWRDGPDAAVALDRAEAQGWHAYDREPGASPEEYAILYLKRECRASHPSP